jgi:hypothetical protein
MIMLGKKLILGVIMATLMSNFSYVTEAHAVSDQFNNENNSFKQVNQAIDIWAQSLIAMDIDGIINLYDEDSILLATLDDTPLFDQAGRKNYFQNLMKKPDIHVDITDRYTRIFGDAAVTSGIYTFSFTNNGEKVLIPARFSFVHLQKDGKWMIIDHHSSKMPH